MTTRQRALSEKLSTNDLAPADYVIHWQPAAGGSSVTVDGRFRVSIVHRASGTLFRLDRNTDEASHQRTSRPWSVVGISSSSEGITELIAQEVGTWP